MAAGQARAPLAVLLTQAERRVVGRLAALLSSAGSSPEEWRVLSCLALDGGRAMSEVAQFVMVPPPTLTKLVDRMVAANLVYRRGDVHDRRRVLLFLTERGRRKHERLNKLIEQEQAELQSVGGVEDLDELARLLSQLIGDLDGHESAAASDVGHLRGPAG